MRHLKTILLCSSAVLAAAGASHIGALDRSVAYRALSLAAGLAGRPAPVLSGAEMAALAVEHYQGLLALYGLRMGVRHARKHLAAYAEAGGGLSGEDRMRLLTTTDPAIAATLLARAFGAETGATLPHAIGEAA